MKSVSIAAESEDQLELLRALRTKLAWELDNASCTRDVEPLARRLAVIGEQIADLTAMKDTSSPADMMAERRRA